MAGKKKQTPFYVYSGEHPFSPTMEWLNERRTKSFDLPIDQPLYLNVGHFICWYSAVEMALTMLLYGMINNHPGGAKLDPDMFHVLSMGMDVKVKTQRLRRAAKARGIEVPHELAWRLDHYNSKIVGVRNHIVHGTLHWPLNEDTLVAHHVGDIVPWGRDQDPDKVRRSYTIEGLELYEHAIWLNVFAYDLAAVGLALLERETLEIESYGTTEPMARYRERLRKAALATEDTQPQKPPPTAQD